MRQFSNSMILPELVLCFLILVLGVHTETDIDKRRPGWGKRAPGADGSPSELEAVEQKLEKRVPGWGKRAPGWGKRTPGWGKRTAFDEDDEELGLDKRRPGWGKRNGDGDMIDSDLSSELSSSMEKRRPGWGKRSFDAEKRRPGWGKRAAQADLYKALSELGSLNKRRPGWGKRAEVKSYLSDLIKRGWGKRFSSLDKRRPGWGKRDGEISQCSALERTMEVYINKALQLETILHKDCTH